MTILTTDHTDQAASLFPPREFQPEPAWPALEEARQLLCRCDAAARQYEQSP